MIEISLKAARINSKLSGKQAADRAGITYEQLRNYENGRTRIPGDVLKSLSKIYGIPVENISLEDEPERINA